MLQLSTYTMASVLRYGLVGGWYDNGNDNDDDSVGSVRRSFAFHGSI